jgi:HK97 family phage major capsid protein
MLASAKIQTRQSEIRQSLAELVGKEKPTEDETRKMGELDAEYRSNETRFRAALIAEDEERAEAGKDLETRDDKEKADLISRFEMRQVALFLDEGRVLDGPTAEIVQEMRSQGGYRGVPVPWAALELRAGETIASGTPDPVSTRPIIDRLFPASIAGRMGAQMINIDSGAIEYPVVTSSVTAGWAATETGSVSGPTAFATTDRSLKPDHTAGITMKVTRKTLKQSGAALEQAVRRDMNSAVSVLLDDAVFNGSGTSGQPSGVIAKAATYSITSTAASATKWATFRAAIARFMVANAIGSPSGVKVGINPATWDTLDGAMFDSGSGLTELDKLLSHVGAGNVVISNQMPGDGASPEAFSALLTTAAGGVAPIFVGAWGGVDLIRDPYSDAASGGLRLTALATMDITVARPAQLQLLTGL